MTIRLAELSLATVLADPNYLATIHPRDIDGLLAELLGVDEYDVVIDGMSRVGQPETYEDALRTQARIRREGRWHVGAVVLHDTVPHWSENEADVVELLAGHMLDAGRITRVENYRLKDGPLGAARRRWVVRLIRDDRSGQVGAEAPCFTLAAAWACVLALWIDKDRAANPTAPTSALPPDGRLYDPDTIRLGSLDHEAAFARAERGARYQNGRLDDQPPGRIFGSGLLRETPGIEDDPGPAVSPAVLEFMTAGVDPASGPDETVVATNAIGPDSFAEVRTIRRFPRLLSSFSGGSTMGRDPFADDIPTGPVPFGRRKKRTAPMGGLTRAESLAPDTALASANADLAALGDAGDGTEPGETEEATKGELSEVLAAFKAREMADRARAELATDGAFYTVLIFPSTLHREAFFRGIGMDDANEDAYVDGVRVARAVKVELPPVPPARGTRQTDAWRSLGTLDVVRGPSSSIPVPEVRKTHGHQKARENRQGAKGRPQHAPSNDRQEKRQEGKRARQGRKGPNRK